MGSSRLPSEVAVGTILELSNTSPTEFHNIVVFKIDSEDTRTLADFVTIPTEEIEMGTGTGNLVGALHAAPGRSAFDGRIRLQAPGRYIAFDAVLEGADPVAVEAAVKTQGAPYSIAGGLPGYQHGMIIEFFVIGQ